MSDKWEKEMVFKIWQNKSGEHFEICPDADTGDMVEVRCVAKDGTIERRLSIPTEIAILMATAIEDVSQSITNKIGESDDARTAEGRE